MTNLPSTLPAALRAAGLTVIEIDGWRERGRPGSFAPLGVLNHHTGASAKGWSAAKCLAYARWMFLTGRSDLNPPLVQLALDPAGRVYIGAAGRANHAGTAKASGTVPAGDGNTLYVGIEWMLSGTEAIPESMMRAGVTLNAVLAEVVLGKIPNTSISAHYQTSVTGKWDIGDPKGIDFKGARVLDMTKFRAAVAAERTRLYAKPVYVQQRMKLMEFNALGASHTDSKGGSRYGKFMRSRRRMVELRKLINVRKPDLIALQEFQPSQARYWRRHLGDKYGLFVTQDDAIAWRRSTVRIRRKVTFTIPYFKGRTKIVPVGLFEFLETGVEVWATSVHNPASGGDRGDQRQNRIIGWQREAKLAAELAKQYPDALFAFMGDRNVKSGDYAKHIPAGSKLITAKVDPWDIDHIAVTKSIKVVAVTSIRNERTAKTSDHRPIIARLIARVRVLTASSN